ncbi:MAG: ATP-dependent helicase, partial [Planctomycetes bacterium]|nr:ATP-dependent helicase [Planctomycetota bacterium]
RAGIASDVIHGNKSQTARQRALYGFRDGRTRVLVATDIAARGIDIDNITHVINFDLPKEPEIYVHRIGRTARAGADGIALTFCDADERRLLMGIERVIKQHIPVVEDHPFQLNLETLPPPNLKSQNQRQSASRVGSKSPSKRRRQVREEQTTTPRALARNAVTSKGRSSTSRPAKVGNIGHKFRNRRG